MLLLLSLLAMIPRHVDGVDNIDETCHPPTHAGREAKHKRNVVSITFLGVDEDDVQVDPNMKAESLQWARDHHAGLGYPTVHAMQTDWATRIVDTSLGAIHNASRFRPAQDPDAPPSVKYADLARHQYSAPVPYVSNILQNGQPIIDLNAILRQHDVCGLVETQNVREVWILKNQAEPGFAAPEFYLSSPHRSHWEEMRWLAEPAPVCKQTYTVVVLDLERYDLFLHVWYHAVEATMRWVDDPLWSLWQGPCQSNYVCHPGATESEWWGEIGRCGNCHNAPNAAGEYDIANPDPVLSDCKDWDPDGEGGHGALSLVDCSLWGCMGDGTIESNPTVLYTQWNLQHMPGHGNQITNDGRALRNWWDAYVDFDAVYPPTVDDGDGFYCPLPGPTASPAPSLPPTPTPITTTVTLVVSSTLDDYKEKPTGAVAKGDATHSLFGSSENLQAYRFPSTENAQIPNGATIESAVLQVYSLNDRYSDRTVDGYAVGNDVGDAAPFQAARYEISAAAKTDATVAIAPDLEPWNFEGHHALADVGPVVQEIVDRADYAQGNALKIFLAGTGNASFRRCKTYDAGSEKAARLVVTFTVPASSCMSGRTRVPRIVEDDAADERRRLGRLTAGRGRESAVANVPVRDLAPGDIIRGLDRNLEETTCTVEAVGSFGFGPVYGNYTNDHFVLDRGSNNVKSHGRRGPRTHEEKFGVLTDCPLGLDESETGFAPIDGDFCGADRSELSWPDYLALHASILRVVRASGGYWFAGGSYADLAAARGRAPAVCRAMLACAADPDDGCAALEAASRAFVDGALTEEARRRTEEAFWNLGRHRELGSVSAVVSRGASVRR